MTAITKGVLRLSLVMLTTIVLAACSSTMASPPSSCKDGFCPMTKGQMSCPCCAGKTDKNMKGCCSGMKGMDNKDRSMPMARMNHGDIYAPAMAKMHRDMMQTPTGDPDVDFMKGMIPHHQAAIDMSEVALSHAHDLQVRKLATEIIKAQKSEIALMQSWLAKHGK
jgi:hypothetical protein